MFKKKILTNISRSVNLMMIIPSNIVGIRRNSINETDDQRKIWC
jgi:hypothetical protein